MHLVYKPYRMCIRRGKVAIASSVRLSQSCCRSSEVLGDPFGWATVACRGSASTWGQSTRRRGIRAPWWSRFDLQQWILGSNIRQVEAVRPVPPGEVYNRLGQRMRRRRRRASGWPLARKVPVGAIVRCEDPRMPRWPRPLVVVDPVGSRR